MTFRADTNIYITNLDDLYSKYERDKAKLNNENVNRKDENIKSKEKKVVTFNSDSITSSTNSNTSSTITNVSNNIEKTILSSLKPISTNQVDQVSVLGYKGIWLNKDEVMSWKGPLPVSQYKFNEDTPQIIKKSVQPVEYVQDVSIRYLKPPLPPQHGDIIIKKENLHKNVVPPPQILRELPPPRPATPEPIIIRERPPQMPEALPSQVVTVPSDDPPPERKVIIERLPQLPPKPAPIIIEKWLPYEKQKRNVIKATTIEAKPDKEKNIIIEWETPKPVVRRQVKYLGIQEANPNDYVKQYASRLKDSEEINSEYNLHAYLQERENQLKAEKAEAHSARNELSNIKPAFLRSLDSLLDTSQYDLIGEVDELKSVRRF